MTIGFTAMQFITGGGATLGMSGAKIEINGKMAPPQLLRCLDPPTNVNERDVPVKFCLPCASSLSRDAAAVCGSCHFCSYRKFTAHTLTGGVQYTSASCSCGISTAKAT
jgi:hypothetical protein